MINVFYLENLRRLLIISFCIHVLLKWLLVKYVFSIVKLYAWVLKMGMHD